MAGQMMSTVETAALIAGLLLVQGPVAVMARRRKSVSGASYGITTGLCAALALIGLVALIGGGDTPELVLPMGLPWLGAHLHIDALSGFFLVVLGLGGAVISLYAIGYGRHEDEPLRVLAFYAPFIGAMTMVVLAADAFTFLLSWEVMSLLSWALVLTNHREAATRNAGYVYLVMAAFGTMSLILAFGLLAGPGGDYTFAGMRALRHSPLLGSAVVILMLLGAGSKAGIFPLHVWLPLAHPAAPSHVSALMSGIMTKVAIYGFIRVTFDLLNASSWWMSMVVMAVGGVTAVMGVLYALMQHDLKKLLAYHTVENIGIIFIGLGLAMAFDVNQMPQAAALALTAALFHIFNHSVFKSLLFLGSGAILTTTGTRDMEKMGGLIHNMPVTAVVFLVGCVAISALPPFNGFVSEWLTFQSILISPDLPQWGLKILSPGIGGLLALAAALAAACFVKVYGVVFLSRPRSDVARDATEVDRYSLTAMAILAAICLLAGVVPGAVIDVLSPVTTAMVHGAMPTQMADPWLTITPIAAGRSTYNGLLVVLFIALSGSFAAWLIHRFASREMRRAPAWDCGFPQDDPATQYNAAGFAQPIRRALGSVVFRARETVDMPPPGDPRPARLTVTLWDPVWDGIFAKIGDVMTRITTVMNRLQFLTIRRYLSLVFASLIFLLLVLTLWN